MKGLFKMVVSLGLMALLLAYSGCEEECGEDVPLGSLPVRTSTESFLPYTGNEVLVFIDSLGNELELNSPNGVIESTSNLNYEKLCDQSFFGSQFTYYDAEAKEIEFYSPDSVIYYRLTLEIAVHRELGADNRLFIYETLGINNQETYQLGIVTYFENNFPPDELEIFTSSSIKLDSIRILDQIYYDIYTYAASIDYEYGAVFFKEGLGIIGFVDKNRNEYVLK